MCKIFNDIFDEFLCKLILKCLYFYFGSQKEKAVEETEEADPDVAAMMGFGGFKSSKK